MAAAVASVTGGFGIEESTGEPMAGSKKDDEYSEAEAKHRFEQALKGAAKAPAKKAKPPAPKRKRPTS